MTGASSVVERIAAFAAGLDIAGLDRRVLESARLSLIDTVGVTIAGARERLSGVAGEHAVATRGTGTCRIIARPGGASPLAAALANGVAAHVLDFDDTIYEGLAHPSAAIIPALLAAAETGGSSGADIMAGLVAGIETVAALGRGFTNAIYDRGTWTTSFLGTIGSAAGASRVLRLGQVETAHAVSIAACQASGSRTVMGTDAKPYLCGRAAEAGLDAALAARAGLNAPALIVEGRSGLAQLVNEGRFAESELDGLGSALSRPIMGYKRFPVCSAAQAAAEAVQEIVREHRVQPADVLAVECIVTPFVASCLPYVAPRTRTEAMFSLEFAVACAVLNGTITPAHLADCEFERLEIRALMAHVKMQVSDRLVPKADAAAHLEAARIEIVTRCGQHFARTLLSASGMPPNRPSFEFIAEKFLANVLPSLDAGGDGLLDRLVRIEEIHNGRSLTGLMMRDA